MRINHNIPALNTSNQLASLTDGLQNSIARLSSGLRVRSAADDAAGLAISEKMRSQVRGLDQAVRNSQDGISMIQTAEGALNESNGILLRMRELAVQAANDTLTQQDRGYIQLEIDQLKEELDRIGDTTQFNKKKLLNGSADVLWSTDTLGTWVNVRGPLAPTSLSGERETTEGNFKITVSVNQSGQNQVLKSNIFKLAMESGESVVAGKNSLLSDIGNFVDSNGVFLLDSPQTLTLSLEGGGNVSLTVYANDTLGTLGEKLDKAIMQASGQNVQGSGAQFVGEADVVPSKTDAILNGMASYWLEGAAKRISDFYGISGTGKSLTIVVAESLNGPGGQVTWDSSRPDTVILSVDKALFLPATPPNGINQMGNTYNDRVIAHEMVHAVMVSNSNLGNAVETGAGIWLKEGLTEYIHGINEDVARYTEAELSPYITRLLSGSETSTIYGTPPSLDSKAYAAAYLVTRYFDQYSTGGGGIKTLIAELSSGKNVDSVISSASGGAFASRSALESSLLGSSFIADVLTEDPTFDTGAIGGAYASKGPALSPANVIGGSGTFKVNPLAGYGWSSVIWPKDMAANTPASVLALSAPRTGTLQAVEGTLLLHSPLAGRTGNITLSGNEDLLKALGFAEVRAAREIVYSIDIQNAHSGSPIASGVPVTGGAIIGLLHRNLDIRLKNNFGLDTDGTGTLHNGYGSFLFREGALRELFIHVASNATVLQIGANEGETLAIAFGDARSKALGVDSVRVMNRELASRSITLIDDALSRLSSRRAQLGAYQNRLEHTIANLTTAAENLTASEGRIRDLDMAKEMLNYTKLNILVQTATSMMGQANQLPQTILQLTR